MSAFVVISIIIIGLLYIYEKSKGIRYKIGLLCKVGNVNQSDEVRDKIMRAFPLGFGIRELDSIIIGIQGELNEI